MNRQPRRQPAHTRRLPDGALRELVQAHLYAYPHLDFSPAELAGALRRPRSRGAIGNACERLVAAGTAVRASSRPRRYQAAATHAPEVDT